MKCKFFLVVFFLALGICGDLKALNLCVEDKFCYDVKVAVEKEELAKGLMFVKSMPQNKGMLFDFRKRQIKNVSMWMKNTFIYLDMLFIGCDGELKDIYKNAKPHSLELIESDTDFCYVLEINGGEADKRGLEIKDKVYIDFELGDS